MKKKKLNQFETENKNSVKYTHSVVKSAENSRYMEKTEVNEKKNRCNQSH